jgi:glycosyl transferase family 25
MRPHAFLINLDRSQDRLARCIPLLEQMGISWERVTGIEGAKLPADELARLNPRPAPHGEWFRGLTPGEIGCFLSHIACWRLIAERGLDCALVLEDDFAPDDGFSAERLAAFADSSAHWDVLKLTRIGRNAKLAMPLEHGASIHHIGKGPIDGTGYLVSLAGARKLIQRREHLLRPVDFDLKHPWERGLRVCSGSPNQFRQVSHEEAASVIGDRTDYRQYPFFQRMGVYLRKHRYHVRYWLAHRLHIGRRKLI